MIHIWTERLTAPRLLFACLRHGPLAWRCYHGAITPAAKMLARLLPADRTEQVPISIGWPDAHGRNLLYRYERLFHAMLERVIARMPDTIPRGYEVVADEWRRVLRGRAYYGFVHKLVLVCAAEHHYQRGGVNEDAPTLIDIRVEPSPLSAEFLRGFTPDIVTPAVARAWPGLRNFIEYFPLPFAIPFVLMRAASAFFARCGDQPQANVATEKGVVFEEFQPNCLDRDIDRTGLYWFPSSGLDAERVVFFFDRHDDVGCYTAARCRELEARGFGWVRLTRPEVHVDSQLELLARTFRLAMPAFPRRLDPAAFWWWSYTVRYVFMIEAMRIPFRRFKARIVHQGREFGPETTALFVAAKLEDAISMWSRWSIDRFPTAHFNFAKSDLVFAWGPFGAAYYNAHDMSYEVMLRTGIIHADKMDPTPDEIAAVRARLQGAVDFIIVLFDSNVSPVTQHDEGLLIEFFEEFFDALAKRPGCGVLLKSKGPTFANLDPASGVHERAAELGRRGQFVALDTETPIGIASCAADFTLSFSINSPGVVAAIAGKPSIHIDTPGNIENPLYDLTEPGRVIVATVDDAFAAIDHYRAGDASYGQTAPIVPLFDEFRDGRGSARAGKVIGRFMEIMEAGDVTPKAALATVAGEYAADWGRERVHLFDDPRDSRLDRLWRDKGIRPATALETA